MSGRGPLDPSGTGVWPSPAYPHRRREPLPWHAPKPADEDPNTSRCVQAILDGPTCRSADRELF